MVKEVNSKCQESPSSVKATRQDGMSFSLRIQEVNSLTPIENALFKAVVSPLCCFYIQVSL